MGFEGRQLRLDTTMVTYNGMGGHRALSFAGALLLGPKPPACGTAFNRIEVYCHIDDPKAPARTLRSLLTRYQAHVKTMPFGTFHRKGKRVEFAMHSSFRTKRTLFDVESSPPTLADVPLVRTVYREIALTLELIGRKVKSSDDFDAAKFLSYIRDRVASLDAASNDAVLRSLRELYDAEQKRVAADLPVAPPVDERRPVNPAGSASQGVEMPTWKVPKNLAKAIEEGDGTWEDERWLPIRLIAMSGTALKGHEIPVAWQVEFDPFDDDFEAANSKLEANRVEPDGYGWGEHVRTVIETFDAALSKRLHLADCDTATCVIWVESERDARTLLETVWKLIYDHG